MNHALGALLILTCAIVLPLRRFEQLAEGFRITFLQEIAGLLPTEDVIRRITPRRALIFFLPHQEIQEEGRLVELPSCLGTTQDLRKEFPRPSLLQEMLLELQDLGKNDLDQLIRDVAKEYDLGSI